MIQQRNTDFFSQLHCLQPVIEAINAVIDCFRGSVDDDLCWLFHSASWGCPLNCILPIKQPMDLNNDLTEMD